MIIRINQTSCRNAILSWTQILHVTLFSRIRNRTSRHNFINQRGAKTEIVEAAVKKRFGEFSISDIERDCPNVSRVMIKKIFMQMQKVKEIKCLGKGQSAKWTRLH